MDITIADQYYLKAKDYYNWNLEFVIENLNYALSNDDEHVQANYLLGKVYMYHLKDFTQAARCFYRAMKFNIRFPDVYEDYILLKIWQNDIEAAQKLINFSMKIGGVNKAVIQIYQSLIYEGRRDFSKAKQVLKFAELISFEHDDLTVIKNSRKRIISKMKLTKQKKSKRE